MTSAEVEFDDLQLDMPETASFEPAGCRHDEAGTVTGAGAGTCACAARVRTSAGAVLLPSVQTHRWWRLSPSA
jgi:hypothetical protein